MVNVHGRNISKLRREGRIEGIKYDMDSEAITHRQFMNDTMVLSEIFLPQIKEIKKSFHVINLKPNKKSTWKKVKPTSSIPR